MESLKFDLSFTWGKPTIGYKWEACEHLSDIFGIEFKIPPPPYLVERHYGQDFDIYQPLEDSTIFATFADLEPTNEAYARWASIYGTLMPHGETLKGPSGITNPLIVLPKECIGPEKIPPFSGITCTIEDGKKGYGQCGESLQFWRKEHKKLSFAFLVWELLNLKDSENLSKILNWHNMNTGVLIHTIGREILPTVDMSKVRGEKRDHNYLFKHGIEMEVVFECEYGNINSWASKICRYPDVIKPALLYVQLSVNDKLREYPLGFVTKINEHGNFINLLQPTSLLSAMWYQFLKVLRGDVKLRRCDVCGRWEDMKTHRDNWRRHRSCANAQCVARSRRKSKEAGKK
jgi:hypothetical protein